MTVSLPTTHTSIYRLITIAALLFIGWSTDTYGKKTNNRPSDNRIPDFRWRTQWKPVPKDYKPFVEENKRMIYATNWPNQPVQDYTYWMHGDTIISGAKFKKLYRSISRHNQKGEWTYFGALRERNMQVAYVPKGQTKRKFHIDFGFRKGDHYKKYDGLYIWICRDDTIESYNVRRRVVQTKEYYNAILEGHSETLSDVITGPKYHEPWFEGVGYFNNPFDSHCGYLWKCFKGNRCVFFICAVGEYFYFSECEELKTEICEARPDFAELERRKIEMVKKIRQRRKSLDSLNRQREIIPNTHKNNYY